MSEKKTLQNLIAENSQLSYFVRKVKMNKELEKLLKVEMKNLLMKAGFLENDLLSFVNAIQVANYEKGCLCLIIENSAFATRLRFIIPELSKRLKVKPSLLKLQSIQYKIRPHHFSIAEISLPSKQTPISHENLKILKDILSMLR